MLFLLTIFLIGCGIVIGSVFGVVWKQDEPSKLESPTRNVSDHGQELGESWRNSSFQWCFLNNFSNWQLSGSDWFLDWVSRQTYQKGACVRACLSTRNNRRVLVTAWRLNRQPVYQQLYLLGNRLAIASLDPDIGVTVYELRDNAMWEQVGNEIEVQKRTLRIACRARMETCWPVFIHKWTRMECHFLDSHKNCPKWNGN